jgi:hypothetical protein
MSATGVNKRSPATTKASPVPREQLALGQVCCVAGVDDRPIDTNDLVCLPFPAMAMVAPCF